MPARIERWRRELLSQHDVWLICSGKPAPIELCRWTCTPPRFRDFLMVQWITCLPFPLWRARGGKKWAMATNMSPCRLTPVGWREYVLLPSELNARSRLLIKGEVGRTKPRH